MPCLAHCLEQEFCPGAVVPSEVAMGTSIQRAANRQGLNFPGGSSVE